MATTQTTGIAHLTVVPENFDPDADAASDEPGSADGQDRARRE